MKHNNYLTVWHAPQNPQTVLGTSKQVLNLLNRDYGIPARVAPTSEVPFNDAIEVPDVHAARAGEVCADAFGRFKVKYL
jgi:hypothetical protein